MTIRRTGKALAATGVLGLAMAGFATPSYADTAVVVSGSLTDSGTEWAGATFTPGSVFGPTVTVTVTAIYDGPGDEFYLLADGLLTDVTDSEPADHRICVNTGTRCFLEREETYTYSVDPSTTNLLVTLLAEDDGRPLSGGFYVSYSRPSGTQATAVSGPGPHIQQFPLPSTGTCDEAQPEGLNWGGVASGGWGKSWARWMHKGEGGFVCTRTLIYNSSTDAWEVD